MDATDLCFTPALDLARLIATREVSPVEVVDALLARIDRLNPALHAYCLVAGEEARVAARAAEAAVARATRPGGSGLGVLAGVPVSIKDITATKGWRTTFGSRLWEHHVPEQDAPLVERLKAAGAILLGKTTTPELGWKGVTDSPLFGITRNPWDLERTPGGSSGGAAAALAAGLGPLASGTDGAGSIRIPASFCGVVGFKPTYGLVPNYPYSAADLVAHAGPMARTVGDVALMLEVIAGPDDRDRNSLPVGPVAYRRVVERAAQGEVGRLRLAWSPNLGYAPVEPEVRALVERAAQRFGELGWSVEELSAAWADPAEAIALLFYPGVAARVESREGWRELADPGLVAVADRFRAKSAVDFARALAARNTLVDQVRPIFERYDLLLTPTMPLAAFPVGLDCPERVAGTARPDLTWTPFTYPFNLTGQPAASVPCGWTAGGLPVGLQIVGRRLGDDLVLAAAAAFEALQPWRGRRPPLDAVA